jgi:uncharacterized protein YjbI with pentapeptide repeats
MNDDGRAMFEAETPVNPYSLLEAVNRSSDGVNTAWLIFLSLMAYLLVAVAGVGHKDLLLNNDITLPILQVKIDLTRFFLFVPILLVLLHMGLMGQLVLLARKTLEFASALRMLETTELRTHPLRLELDNFFFVQAMAGPERSRIVGGFLHSISWLTLVLMPVLLLVYVQLVFLPFHDITITWAHRLAVLADIALLVLIGVFLLRSETSFLSASLYATLQHPVGLIVTAAALAAAGFFSLFVATIPGEPVDRYAHRQAADSDGRFVFGYALPGFVAAGDGSLFGLFHRNLHVVDADLVVDKDVTPGEPSLNLRGRDLRFARLDRTDLHQADMTGANLDGASLIGADLRGIWLQCADLSAMLLAQDRRAARCASARAADLSKARLGDARMSGLDLTGAKLEDARLEGADLSHSWMPGANFAGARLDRADLSGGAALQGANFLLASLQGADLSGAKLQMADFSNAAMQGANLSLASLDGALLREADLEGASLASARLVGADMSGARLQGADLSRALVWRTAPPRGDAVALADLAQVVISPPGEGDSAGLKAAVDTLNGVLRVRLTEGMATLGDAAQNAAWAASADLQTWASLVRASEAATGEGYRAAITDHLAKMMCRPRFAGGAVAVGIARRAMSQSFKGDVGLLYDRLMAADCAAASAISPRLMRELAGAADAARAQ